MKSSVQVFFVLTMMFISSAFVSGREFVQTNSGKSSNKPIPAEVMKILEKSCIDCHSGPGSGIARLHVDLSAWDKYSGKAQISKAKAMCRMVTKGKMPTKNYRKNHPELIPTADDVKVLCSWANSIAGSKK